MPTSFNVILIAAVAPALVLAYYIYRRDKYQHEPISQLVKGFLFGAVSVFLAAPAEMLLVRLGLAPDNPQTWLECVWDAFFGVALVEEGVKLFFLWLLLRNNRYYDEMIDGVVYAAMVGLGFAAAENISYLVSNLDSWQSVAVGRAIFAIPGHYMFAVAMGYYYSRNHFFRLSTYEQSKVLLVPILLHGTYDAILMIMNATPAISGILMLVFVVFCIRMPKMAERKINKLLQDDNLEREPKYFDLQLKN